jgi:hypothetical protein
MPPLGTLLISFDSEAEIPKIFSFGPGGRKFTWPVGSSLFVTLTVFREFAAERSGGSDCAQLTANRSNSHLNGIVVDCNRPELKRIISNHQPLPLGSARFHLFRRMFRSAAPVGSSIRLTMAAVEGIKAVARPLLR